MRIVGWRWNSGPPKEAVYTPVYLRQGSGPSEHSLNNGELTFDAPSGEKSGEASGESYTYDPADSIPSGLTFQEEIEGRMLTYTAAVLSEPLRLIGPVTALIYASSSALDTEWLVHLCDVRPDGRSVRICDGALCARYRNPDQSEVLLEPGVVYPFAIDMTVTAHTFLPGHRLRGWLSPAATFPGWTVTSTPAVPLARKHIGRWRKIRSITTPNILRTSCCP